VDVCFGAVAVCSGAVATNKGVPILIIFSGFCKGDGEDTLYGDDVSNDCL
jgi:hypothetical protein